MEVSIVHQKSPFLYERSYTEDIVFLLRHLRYILAQVQKRSRRCGGLRSGLPFLWIHFKSHKNLIEHVVDVTSFTLQKLISPFPNIFNTTQIEHPKKTHPTK